MAAPDVINNDCYFNGNCVFRSISLPAGEIENNEIGANAAIAASKLIHQQGISYMQVPGTAIVAATQDIAIVHGATGLLVAFKAAITGAIATDVSRTVDVDLQKSTGAGAFATVLSATIQFTNASVLRTVSSAAFSADDLLTGDILRVVVTVAGGSGVQAQGLIVTCYLYQDPN